MQVVVVLCSRIKFEIDPRADGGVDESWAVAQARVGRCNDCNVKYFFATVCRGVVVYHTGAIRKCKFETGPRRRRRRLCTRRGAHVYTESRDAAPMRLRSGRPALNWRTCAICWRSYSATTPIS